MISLAQFSCCYCGLSWLIDPTSVSTPYWKQYTKILKEMTMENASSLSLVGWKLGKRLPVWGRCLSRVLKYYFVPVAGPRSIFRAPRMFFGYPTAPESNKDILRCSGLKRLGTSILIINSSRAQISPKVRGFCLVWLALFHGTNEVVNHHSWTNWRHQSIAKSVFSIASWKN